MVKVDLALYKLLFINVYKISKIIANELQPGYVGN